MAKEKRLFLIKKNFAILQDGEKVYIRKFKKDDGGMYVVDKKGVKVQNVLELSAEAIKVGKKCKAIEEVDE